mgnify:CR=1 FL=1
MIVSAFISVEKIFIVTKDLSEAKLKIVHTDEDVGLEVYTNAGAQTTQPQLKVGRSGEQTETITVSSSGTIAVAFTGLHSANSTLNIVDDNTRICMLDGGGSDCNANFTIVSTNASADHAYYNSGAKAGYTFPKPLIEIHGKPMIQWVAELSAEAVGQKNVYIATENKKIFRCKLFA